MLGFVLSYHIVFSYILYYYYHTEACLIFNERQKEGMFRWEERWGEAERTRGKEYHNQDILCVKNI